ncbi:MAG: NAD-glutamate dehydrogenase, partial [Caulobacteraceae bacterium]|nr:NAD-glutamate dehydrogenase [Caulobacteraceae bacterium]
MAERSGALAPAERDPLLASMTEEIARHVLAHNDAQGLALSLLEARAADDLPADVAFMQALEARGRLDRALEGLPDSGRISERAAAGKGLTRPELAVLLAYGKIDLFDDIIASKAPDDPFFVATLRGYFPKALKPFQAEMDRHRLKREIIATVIGNDLVNLCGPTFPNRLRAAAGCDTDDLVAAFQGAREIMRFDEAWRRVQALTGKAPAAGQTALFQELVYVLRGQVYWLARQWGRDTPEVKSLVAAYRPAMDSLKSLAPQVFSPFERQAAARRARVWIRAGAPKDLSHAIAVMQPLNAAPAIANIAVAQGWPFEAAAHVYFKVGGAFAFDRLRAAAGALLGRDAFERLALRRLIEDIRAEQAALARTVMTHAGVPAETAPPQRAAGAVVDWARDHAGVAEAARATLSDIEAAGGGWTFAKLTIANAALRELSAA